MTEDPGLRKVQVKTVRVQPWYVSVADFKRERRDQVTVYVLLGALEGTKSVRYFIAKNSNLAKHVHRPSGWKQYGFMSIRAVEKYEDQWDSLRT